MIDYYDIIISYVHCTYRYTTSNIGFEPYFSKPDKHFFKDAMLIHIYIIQNCKRMYL